VQWLSRANRSASQQWSAIGLFYRRIGYRSSSAPTFGGPAGSEELVLPVALLLNKTLFKKVVVAVLIAAAEVVLAGPAKGKVKR
jgi:hypothetical protein